VVEEVYEVYKKDSKTVVLYFFFDGTDPTKQTLDSMIRSLLVQLVARYQSIPPALQSLLSQCKERSSQPRTEALNAAFDEIAKCKTFDKVFNILDALDECKDSEDLLSDFIKPLMNDEEGIVNMLMTSRKEKSIDDFFADELTADQRFPVPKKRVDEDIRSCVRDRLENDGGFKRWRDRPHTREMIENKLMAKADGS